MAHRLLQIRAGGVDEAKNQDQRRRRGGRGLKSGIRGVVEVAEAGNPALVFAAVVAVATSVVFGLAPALGVLRIEVSRSLKQDGEARPRGARFSHQ